MPSTNICAFLKCKNTSTRMPHLSFHRFPKNESLATEWILRSGNDKLFDLGPKQLHEKRLCAEHFDESCFSGDPNGRKRRLLSNALPIFFLHDSNDSINNQIHATNCMSISPSCELHDINTYNTPISSGSSINDLSPPVYSHTTNSRTNNNYRSNYLLKKKINILQKKLDNARKVIKNMKRAKTAKKSRTVTVKTVLEDAAKFLNKNQLLILKMQLVRVLKKKTEWTPSEQRFATSLYYISPKAYNFLRDEKNITLPCVGSIRQWINNLEMMTGFNDRLFSIIRDKAKGMSPDECDAVLTWDEMSIKEHLEFNSKIDFIEGLEDLGELGRKNKNGKYALVFMIRGLKFPWKLPIAYFISRQNITGSTLANLIKLSVKKCFEVGIRIRSTVCDQKRVEAWGIRGGGEPSEYVVGFAWPGTDARRIAANEIADSGREGKPDPHVSALKRFKAVRKDAALDGNDVGANTPDYCVKHTDFRMLGDGAVSEERLECDECIHPV
ncbi:uncharacterized protein LOC112904941 [Agrilus planipennis]|uniref:Uncharacterized protein LOC112904941 n=1 Tax=Agrilus planipennis TaxID=224129 RepID=A0A7F5R7V0_AGRPL|nr:uncharacterized protein LOC112904941 [Agrilus planipennis]